MEAKAMKKFFIFLFSVFLITFMGCSPATGEIPEETFEVIALDDDGNIIADIEKINAEFNYGWSGTSYIRPYFYKKIRVNNKIYTANVSSNIELGTFNEEYFFINSTNNTIPIDFIDFYKGISTIIYSIGDENTTITFSDLYEEVVQ
jgi:hypothetical protein